MRNRLIVLLILLGLLGFAGAEDPATLPKEVLHFDGYTLLLASQETNPTESVKEYLLAPEKLDSWTKLAAIHDYPKFNDPVTAAQNQIRALHERDPRARSSMIQNPKTGEVIVDFVSVSGNDFVEFDIFKYAKKPGGGVVAEQYALRNYKDIAGFLRALQPLRPRLLDLMTTTGFKLDQ